MKKQLTLTCSGGETSMTMVLWCLTNLKDEYDMVVVFVNTGQEEDETLDFVWKCQNHFKIPIYWIEAKVYHEKRKSSGYKNVTYLSATRKDGWRKRNDTPFEEVIKKYNIPNHSRLHCTRELKMNPIKAFSIDYWKSFENEQYPKVLIRSEICNKLQKVCKRRNNSKLKYYSEKLNSLKSAIERQGYKKYKPQYYLALGIRSDERDRINENAEKLRLIYPLVRKTMRPMTKKHVNFWWSQQPFRLNLKGYQGNCVTCYKKSNNKLYQIAKEQPEAFDFFEKMELKYGNADGDIPTSKHPTIELSQEQQTKADNLKFLLTVEVVTEQEKKIENYKNVFFRGYKSASEIKEGAKNFDGSIIDDHIETESCEIFSNCGDLE